MPQGPANYRITLRDKELLEVLVHRVRVLSVPQIARTWWTERNQKEVARRLKVLEDAGLVHIFRALSHPELTLAEPVISWLPGQVEPMFGQAAYRLQARWNQSPLSLQCAIATALAGRSFGGSGGRFPRESEHTHDLHMATVFLRYRATHPEVVQFWRSEARILWERGGSKTEKLPDAFLDHPDETKIIEFGGAYSKPKLERFHQYCQAIDTAYEVW